SSTALTALKIAVFAPTPSASVSTATAVKPGFLRHALKAKITSFIPERLHRINAGRAERRNSACRDRGDDEDTGGSGEGYRIGGTDAIEQRCERARKCERQRKAKHGPAQRESDAFAQNHPEHVASARAKRHSHADLMCPSRHRLVHQAVNSD